MEKQKKPDSRKPSRVKVQDLKPESDPKGGFIGGVRVAAGDVNNDGAEGLYIDDIIIGTKPKTGR